MHLWFVAASQFILQVLIPSGVGRVASFMGVGQKGRGKKISALLSNLRHYTVFSLLVNRNSFSSNYLSPEYMHHYCYKCNQINNVKFNVIQYLKTCNVYKQLDRNRIFTCKLGKRNCNGVLAKMTTNLN